MYKQISQEDITRRNFKVYKEWSFDQSIVPVIVAQDEPGLFDSDSNKSSGVYTHPLYHSIKAKYYSSKGNVITQFGLMKNPAEWEIERGFSDVITVIQIPQIKYGEQIKRNSVIFTDNDNDVTYVDDGFGNLKTESPTYTFNSYDVETQIMVFDDGITTYDVTVSFIDMETGDVIFTIGGDTDNNYVSHIDFDTNLIRLDRDLVFPDDDLSDVVLGNVFYDDGLIVLTNGLLFTNYIVSYKSTKTIEETEVLVTVREGEFNYSQNPMAVNVTKGEDYIWTTTPIVNGPDATDIIIKDIKDITRVSEFHGTVGSTIGTWEDYDDLGRSDTTGSYIAPFITTIGLYDKNGDMLAVAKLPKPIKNLPDYNVNFLIRLDS